MKGVLLFLAAASALLGQTAATGTIEGTVVNAATRSPVRGAVVTTYVQRVSPDSGKPGGAEPVSARTDASGHFTLGRIPAGQYHVLARHPRYLDSQEAPMVTVQEGANASVHLTLAPGATISGRVTDEYGDPVAGCMASLVPGSALRHVSSRGSQHSDAKGIFAIWGITPGRVRLMLRCTAPIVEPHPLRPVNQPAPPPSVGYPPVYYPGGTDLQQTQTIEIEAGAEKNGIDFEMRPERVYTITGAIRPAGAHLKDAVVMIVPRDRALREVMGGNGGSIDPDRGTFRIQGAFAGDYMMSAVVRDGTKAVAIARQAVTVPVSRAIDLELNSAFEVTGIVEVRGETKPPLSTIRVQLIEMDPVGAAVEHASVNENREFTIPTVLPGVYRVEAPLMNVFVTSVSIGGEEAKGGIVDLSAGPPGPLHVILSDRYAWLRGTATPGTVVQARETAGPWWQAWGAQADAQGAFQIRLRPGRYRLVLAGEEDSAEEVELAEGETKTIVVGSR